jgi:hypothetical protein
MWIGAGVADQPAASSIMLEALQIEVSTGRLDLSTKLNDFVIQKVITFLLIALITARLTPNRVKKADYYYVTFTLLYPPFPLLPFVQ